MDYAFSNFLLDVRTGIDRLLDEKGMEAVFFGVGNLNPKNPEDSLKKLFFEMITPAEFDGVIMVSATLAHNGQNEELLAIINRLSSLPVVSIGPSVAGEPSFTFDNISGMRTIMKHLLDDHGYRDFAFVSGPMSNREAWLRKEIYLAALDEAGIKRDENREFEGNFNAPSGYEAAVTFIEKRKIRPQVIVCSNDMMAAGVYNALADRGISVPFDIAVTGYDDHQISRTVSHQFTTVSQSFDTLGYHAAKHLASIIEGHEGPVSPPWQPQIRIRNSCGCVDFTRRMPERIDACATLYTEVEDVLTTEKNEVLRKWASMVTSILKDQKSRHELEQVLHLVSEHTLTRTGEALPVELYAYLLEEYGHRTYTDYWRTVLHTQSLRILLERLHSELAQDLRIEKHLATCSEIAEVCGADKAALLRFRSFGKIDNGAAAIFSFNISYPHNRAGSGSWFPPRGTGSLVANMILDDERAYGFVLIDERIPEVSAFDQLRISSIAITKDILAIAKIQRLNRRLKSENTIRQRTENKLKEAISLVERMSIEDELTHLYNRRGFLAMAEQQVKYLRRQQTPFYVLYADLDGLKIINDKWGHADGDLAILSAGEVLKKTLRDSDLVARLGGDEYTALVLKAEPPNYPAIKARIDRAFDEKNRELGKEWTLAISIGHFYSGVDCAMSLEQMMEEADTDLYREKQKKKGRRHNAEYGRH